MAIYFHCSKEFLLKGMLLSKALTCINFFLYNQKWLFYHGDGHPWLCCCMNHLYMSHISRYAPTNSFWALGSMLISRCWVTSSFYSVYNIMTHWQNLRVKHLHEHELQLSDYNMGKYFDQNICFSGIIYNSGFLPWTLYKYKCVKIFSTRNAYIWATILTRIVVG